MATAASDQKIGKVIQVIGPVIDVEYEGGYLPAIYNAVRIVATLETGEQVAGRIRAALAHVSADRLVVSPDCGFKYLDRSVAFAKLLAMVAGARVVRAELV